MSTSSSLSPTSNPSARTQKRNVAIFISADSFEHFFGGMFNIDRENYLSSYRNDFVWDYAFGLRKQGHLVYIYVLSYGRAEIREVEPGISVRFLPLPSWLKVVDPIVYRLAKTRIFHSLREKVRFAAYGRVLRESLQSDRIGMVYHQEIWTARFDEVATKISVPILGADQGATYLAHTASVKRRSIPRARLVCCQSLVNLGLVENFGGKAVLLYNAVDSTFFVPADSDAPRPHTLLTVDRLVDEQKRFSDLLVALQKLPDFSLHLVGSGPDEARLRALASELGVGERVEFLGFVSDRNRLRELYQNCGVFISTSSWEAVALVMLEAMSCGAPVVATAIPSFRDLISDGVDGLLVPVGAPEDAAQAVRRAFEQQAQLGTAARKTILDRYSAEGLYSRLSNLIA